MIRRRLNFLSFSLKAVTLFLPVVAFAGATEIRFSSGIFPSEASDLDPMLYVGLLVFTTLVWAVAADCFGLLRVDQLFAARGKVRRLFLACLTTYGAVMGFGFFYRGGSFSRIFVALSGMLLFLLAGTTCLGFRTLLDPRRRNGKNSIRILIVGADQLARRTANLLVSLGIMPCSLVGYVRLPGQAAEAADAPVYELDDVDRLAVGNGIDDVIIAIPPARLAELPVLTKKLAPLCAPVRAILDFGDGVFAREQLFDFGRMLMLDLQTTPAETVEYLLLKRSFDVVFSLCVLAITAPLMALIALAIRLTSPGPILFVQERVGLNGALFRMYKFRTMRVCGSQESATSWTVPDDPRRTPLGSFLRRMNLDELPQFFNVLKGDMSVVGPRPERPHFVQTFLQQVAKYNSRHYLKVGITGWAQVNGLRGDTSIAKRVEYDLYYLRNWSFLLDLQIIFLTVTRGFASKNAY
jgi:Undecaprenyl-phosphate glucose phosphotransferase